MSTTMKNWHFVVRDQFVLIEEHDGASVAKVSRAGRDASEVLALAHLIAAAPAMLAVLDNLIAYHVDDGTFLDEIVREARAARAQARGETT